MKNNDINRITTILKEIVNAENVDISSIQMHSKLNSKIWQSNEKLYLDVRKSLLLNAKRFIEFCDIENFRYSDIILTGSLANYNYNNNSDLDIHIVLDYTQISNDIEIVDELFKVKKKLWSEYLSNKIKGFDVELYIQNSNENHISSGIYSIYYDNWIVKPIKKIININTYVLQKKASELMNEIDDLEKNFKQKNFLFKLNRLKNKIKKYRQIGLEEKGEFSNENLVFKILRYNGYLKKLYNLKIKYLNNELTLNEFKH